MTAGISARLRPYLTSQLGMDGLTIDSVDRISGAGLSRGVLKVDATAGDGTKLAWIVLLADSASPVPPNRTAEYAAMRALSQYADLNVPRAHCVEESGDVLGSPFLVTEHLPGLTNGARLLDPEYEPHARHIVRDSFAILGRLSRVDPAVVPLGPEVDALAAGDVHLAELDRHEAILREAGALDRPVISAALRHLHRSIPAPPDRVTVVHGDFRLGNYLFDKNGVTGLIDWEMVHKGDPLEDIAWACLPNWQSMKRPGLIATCLSREDVIAAWEEASGANVDRDALRWWLLLCQVKAAGVRATALHMFQTGRAADLLMGLVGHGLPLEETFVIDAWKECQR